MSPEKPNSDDSNIHLAINRLVLKGLGAEYPCQVGNRFRCPFERSANRKDNGI